jgi:hypothetical protein
MRVEGNGASGSGQRVEGGRFIISDVIPGRYVLRAEIRSPPASNAPPPTEAGVVDLGVVSANVEDIVITTKKAVSVRGVVTFEDGAPPPEAQNSKLRIEPLRTGGQWLSSHRSAADVRPDLTFELQDLIRPYVLTVGGVPAGSAVKSIQYRGRDIAYVPTEFDGDPQHVVEVVVTRRISELSGRAMDASGNPAAAARIYAFPADPARWRGWSRGAARSNASGAYRIRSLVSGDYLVVAISEQDLKQTTSAEWFRPHPYERLATLNAFPCSRAIVACSTCA